MSSIVIDEFVTSWDSVLASIGEDSGLDRLQIQRTQKAISTLASHIGDGIFRKDISHPIVNLVMNDVPWTRRWLVWFADQLKCFSQCDGFTSLIHALKLPDRFWDSIFTLETAEKLAKSKGTILFESDPDKGFSKQADLRLRIGDEIVHVELTTCAASMQEGRVWGTFNSIVLNVLIHKPKGLHHAGRVIRWLSEQHQREIQSKIREAFQSAIENGFTAIEKPHCFQFAASDNAHIDKLNKWAIERSLEIDGFNGPEVSVDELSRVCNKLRKKSSSGQLPPQEPGLIVIQSSRALGPYSDIAEITVNLEEEVSECPGLIGVVLIGGYNGVGEEITRRISKSYFSSRSKPDIKFEYSLYVPNDFAKVELSKESQALIEKCFQ